MPDSPESLEVVEEVGEGVAVLLLDVVAGKENGVVVVANPGTPSHSSGTWILSALPVGTAVVTPPPAWVTLRPMDAIFCCCSMRASTCFCMSSSWSVEEGSCL